MNTVFTNKALKDLNAMEKQQVLNVRKGINNYALTGKGDIKSLKGEYKGLYRLRVGDYRVILFMTGNNITVTNVLNRRDAYKKGAI